MFIPFILTAALLISLGAAPAFSQTATDPFPAPIAATDGVVRVSFVEFAQLPDIAQAAGAVSNSAAQAARMMLLVDEPGTRRLFVNDMRGPLYTVSYDGKTVALYVDINAPAWGVNVNSAGNERGFQSFAFPPEFGLLYMGFADGGSGGDPLELGQNLGTVFGKLLPIDPLGRNSTNGKYGVPASNPFVADNDPATLGEIYAYGLRNPQRFSWDPKNGNLFLADIGQNIVEEIDLVTAGANLGWNDWEGSFAFLSRAGVSLENQRGDATMVYPIVEYGQADPLLQGSSAVTMGYVYRGTAIKHLANLLIFGDNPSGEVFYVSADNLPKGGQDPIRRVLFNDPADRTSAKTLLQIIKEKNTAQGKTPATRADLRFGQGPDGQILLLNKRDGVIRLLVPDGDSRLSTR